jgi:hypothetical protein
MRRVLSGKRKVNVSALAEFSALFLGGDAAK